MLLMTPAAFHVLLALASGATHGYVVMGFVEQVTDGAVTLGPGTLYRTIARLAADGLVVETEGDDDSAPHEARRRYYKLTPAGEEAAAREAERLASLVDAAGKAGLLRDRQPA
jgi:DNA-binding PadR family transcriptional regulator